MIKAFFTGRLGKDAERKSLANGTALAGFSVATDVGYGDNKQTMWLDCTIFGKRAESKLIDYLTKGAQVAISGDLSTREYNDKTYLQVRVDEIDLMGGKTEGKTAKPAQQFDKQDINDDIPF